MPDHPGPAPSSRVKRVEVEPREIGMHDARTAVTRNPRERARAPPPVLRQEGEPEARIRDLRCPLSSLRPLGEYENSLESQAIPHGTGDGELRRQEATRLASG